VADRSSDDEEDKDGDKNEDGFILLGLDEL